MKEADSTMRLGAVLPHNDIGTDVGAIRHYLQGLEELGLTHLLVRDHVLTNNPPATSPGARSPFSATRPFHEPFTFLSFAAAVAPSLELITAVIILPQRQTALVAKQSAELAVLSGDRLRLGVGIGWNDVEYVALGADFATRARRQVEQIEVLRRLWSEPLVDFDGEFHRIPNAGIVPRPRAPIPIWFGGSAPAVLKRCAALGDGWMPLGEPDETAAARLADIRLHRKAAGRSMAGFAVQAEVQWEAARQDRWREHTTRWRDLGATHLAIMTHSRPATIEDHLARLREYRDATLDIASRTRPRHEP